MSKKNSVELILPPEKVRNGGQDFEWEASSINYEQHPAYAKLIENKSFSTKVRACLLFTKSFISVLIKRLISYELIPLEFRQPRNLKARFSFFSLALKNIFFRKKRNYQRLGNDFTQKVFAFFKENGVSVIGLTTSATKELEALSSDSFSKLTDKRSDNDVKSRTFEESRSSVRRDSNNELFHAIENILEEAGIFDVASSYLGQKAKLVDVNPQINDKSDDFWKKVFPDKDDKLPDTAYFHRDASGGDLKAIIYMSEVNEGNGPFTYSLGTNQIKISCLNDLICESNDSNGLASTLPEARKLFAGLPKWLRQKGTFGNDLRPTDKLHNLIINSAWAITAEKGSVVLFDTKGIHRGGFVTSGQRKVITCVIG